MTSTEPFVITNSGELTQKLTNSPSVEPLQYYYRYKLDVFWFRFILQAKVNSWDIQISCCIYVLPLLSFSKFSSIEQAGLEIQKGIMGATVIPSHEVMRNGIDNPKAGRNYPDCMVHSSHLARKHLARNLWDQYGVASNVCWLVRCLWKIFVGAYKAVRR